MGIGGTGVNVVIPTSAAGMIQQDPLKAVVAVNGPVGLCGLRQKAPRQIEPTRL